MSQEKYIGVKFKAIKLGDFKPTAAEKKLIIQLIKVGQEYCRLGFSDKNGGNLSARTKSGFIIKRTGSYPDKLKSGDFVLVAKTSPQKVYYYGSALPSSEARLHDGIYGKRQDINCVLHAHDKIAINSKIKFSDIGYIKQITYGSLKSAHAAAKQAQNFNYLIQKSHGVVALGKNIVQAQKIIKKYHDRFKKAASAAA